MRNQYYTPITRRTPKRTPQRIADMWTKLPYRVWEHGHPYLVIRPSMSNRKGTYKRTKQAMKFNLRPPM